MGSLEEFEGDLWGRLEKAVRNQETIVVCGAGWENIELLELLAKLIPKNHKVIELAGHRGVRLGAAFLPPDYVVLPYDNSLANIVVEASNVEGDYLIMSEMKDSDIGVLQDIAYNFKGGIIAGILDAAVFQSDTGDSPLVLPALLGSIADVLIQTTLRDKAKFGIGRVWARPGRQPREAIPAQDAGPHFVISAAGQISQESASTLDAGGNDIRRIRQLLPLVRQSADDLAARLNPNDNAYTELARDITQYRNAISRRELEIAWGLVWGLGVRLEEAAAAAEREISNRLAPALEDAELAALQSLRALHAPLILATAEGRELQEQADRLRMTREEQAALRADAVAFSVSLIQNEDIIIELDAAAVVEGAAGAIGEGRHPERGTVFGIATIGNVLIVLASAAVIAIPSQFIGGVPGIVVGMGTWEAMKKTRIFATASAALSVDFNRLLESSGTAVQRHLIRLAPFRQFVRAHESDLRRLIASKPQWRWMLAYIDYIVRNDSLGSTDKIKGG
jgi:hypothetical protein